MHTINTLLIALTLLISASSHSAEQLFTTQKSVTPKLAQSGKYNVGVTTVSAVNPNQLSTSDFISWSDRELTLEVWYPYQESENSKKLSMAKATYKDQTR
ncbi:MAG: hypothetical protein ACJAQ6_001030 [Arenicella sp.]|jgi:hypothetical protein